MNKLDFEAVNQALDAETVVPKWAPDGERRGDEWVARNPTRADKNPGSFTINLRRGVWKEYATGEGGSDLVSLYAYLFHGNDQGTAARELADNHGIRIGDAETRERAAEQAKVRSIEEAKPTPVFPVPVSATEPTFRHPKFGKPAPDRIWTYRDKQGRTLLHVCRFDPPGERKAIRPYSWVRDPSGAEKWDWRGITGNARRPLYGLELLQADTEADAIVVEGERTAEAGRRLFGQAAIVTTWLGGVETADRANITALAGRRVVLWPDFDALRNEAGVLLPFHEQPSIRAMMTIAQALKGVARETFMVGYQMDPDRHGWDLADAEAEGWSADQVAAYMAQNSGDPWHVASGRAQGRQDAPGAASGEQAALPVPANDNAPRVPLDARVNPYLYPDMGEKGQPMNTVENLAYMLGEYGIRCRYNEIRKLVEVTLPGRSYSIDNRANNSLAEITSIAARNRMPQSMLQDYIKLLADHDSYNPAADWIVSKPWDGTSRLQALYDTVRVNGDQGLKQSLMFRWLLSAIAALFMEHGFESHGALVFTGPQGTGKTTWFRRLVPRDLAVVLTGAMVDPSQKDTVTNVISHWIVELGELDATFRKADIARLKSFITLPADKLRRPYDRIESDYQRRTVFCASVNDDKYLVDDTGNRRWWTVPVVQIDYMHGINMQQLWAEVLVLFNQGNQHWLTPEENDALALLNAEHENVDPVEEMVREAFRWDEFGGMGGPMMTATQVLVAIGFDKPSKQQATHASKVLKKLTRAEPVKKNDGRYFQMPLRVLRSGAVNYGHNDQSRPF